MEDLNFISKTYFLEYCLKYNPNTFNRLFEIDNSIYDIYFALKTRVRNTCSFLPQNIVFMLKSNQEIFTTIFKAYIKLNYKLFITYLLQYANRKYIKINSVHYVNMLIECIKHDRTEYIKLVHTMHPPANDLYVEICHMHHLFNVAYEHHKLDQFLEYVIEYFNFNQIILLLLKGDIKIYDKLLWYGENFNRNFGNINKCLLPGINGQVSNVYIQQCKNIVQGNIDEINIYDDKDMFKIAMANKQWSIAEKIIINSKNKYQFIKMCLTQHKYNLFVLCIENINNRNVKPILTDIYQLDDIKALKLVFKLNPDLKVVGSYIKDCSYNGAICCLKYLIPLTDPIICNEMLRHITGHGLPGPIQEYLNQHYDDSNAVGWQVNL